MHATDTVAVLPAQMVRAATRLRALGKTRQAASTAFEDHVTGAGSDDGVWIGV
jgi:hypothetical protein